MCEARGLQSPGPSSVWQVQIRERVVDWGGGQPGNAPERPSARRPLDRRQHSIWPCQVWARDRQESWGGVAASVCARERGHLQCSGGSAGCRRGLASLAVSLVSRAPWVHLSEAPALCICPSPGAQFHLPP